MVTNMTVKYKGQQVVPLDPKKVIAARRSMYKRTGQMHRTEAGRYRAEYTQYNLAEDAGVSRSFISEIEIGRKQPRALVAKAIAEALHVDLDDLI